MVVCESNINNIIGSLENTGGVTLHNHRKKLKQRFDIIKKLGQGTYGKVQLGINKETGQEVAIKTIKKCKIETEADLVRIRREIQIMSSVQHPNIIHIYEVFENREKMVLVMEYAAGGELYDYLSEKKKLNEDEARRIFRQIVTAVYYCHKHKICHRDLKLENILLDEHGSAKIADFGLSNVFDERRQLSTFCGSPLYASPEIVNGTPYHGPEVDCWSLGVLLYTLVYGAMPFDGSNFKRLVRQISNGEYFEPKKPSTASPLIRGMLTVKPTERSDISQICSHWWVNQNYKESCLDIAEDLANQTPVRLDYLLSLAPPPPQVGSDKLVVTDEATNSGINAPIENEVKVPTRSHSVGSLMEIGPSAERRIRELQAPSKRKLEVTVSTENANLSNTGAKRKERPPKKEKEVYNAPITEERITNEPEIPQTEPELLLPKSLTQTISKPMDIDQLIEPKISKTENVQPVLGDNIPEIQGAGCKELIEELSKINLKQPVENVAQPEPKTETPVETSPEKSPEKLEERKTEAKTPDKPKKIVKKIVKKKVPIDKKVEKTETSEPKKSPEPTEPKAEKPESESPKKVETPPKEESPPDKTIERRRSKIFETAEKFQNLVKPESAPKILDKPKKIIIPGVSVGGFKKEFERKASLTSSSPLLKNSTTKLKEKSPEKPKIATKKPEETKTIPNETPQPILEPKLVENSSKSIDEPKTEKTMVQKITPKEPSPESKAVEITKETKLAQPELKTVQNESNLTQKEPKAVKSGSPIQNNKIKETKPLQDEPKVIQEVKLVQKEPKVVPMESKLVTEPKTTDSKIAKAKPEVKTIAEPKMVSEPKVVEQKMVNENEPKIQNGSKLLQDKTNLVEENKNVVQKPFVVPNKPVLANHNRSNSVPNSQFLGSNTPKVNQNFENQAPIDDEIRKKRQQAVSIISNAISKEGARKSKSKPSVLRKTPLPFGTSGRSASGNIPSLPMSPEPVMAKNLAISEESLEDRSPSESKRSSVEITLRGTIPARKTTKAEIKLNYPSPKPANMEFTTEVKHHIEAPEKFGDRPIPPPMKFRSTSCDSEIKNRDSPKERIIPISFEKEDNKPELTTAVPGSAKPPMPKNSHSMRSIHSRTGSMSRQSTQDSDSESTITHSESGEPIKRSPKEYIIPIAVEGGGYVTPKNANSDTESPSISSSLGRSNIFKFGRTKRMSSIFDEDESPSGTLHRRNSIGRDSDNEDSSRKEPFHMHRLRSSRPTRKTNLEHTDSLSSAEEDDDDDGFEILTAENLFSTLLSRVRNLTQRLNVEDNGRLGFPSSSLLRDFDNRTNSMFMNDPITTRYSIFNQSRPRSSRSPSSGSSAPWRRSVSRDLANDIEKVASGSSATLPRGKSKDRKKNIDLSKEDNLALSYLTPGLSRRIRKHLLSSHIPGSHSSINENGNDVVPELPEDNRTSSKIKTRLNRSISQDHGTSKYSTNQKSNPEKSDFLYNYNQNTNNNDINNSSYNRITPLRNTMLPTSKYSNSYSEVGNSASRFLRSSFHEDLQRQREKETQKVLKEIRKKREIKENLTEEPEINTETQIEEVPISEEPPKVEKKSRISRLLRPKSYPAEIENFQNPPVCNGLPSEETPTPEAPLKNSSPKSKINTLVRPKVADKASKVENTIRSLRERSLPHSSDVTESNLIKRAVSLEDFGVLSPPILFKDKALQTSRKSVTKILNLFEKYDGQGKKKNGDSKGTKKSIKDSKIPSSKKEGIVEQNLSPLEQIKMQKDRICVNQNGDGRDKLPTLKLNLTSDYNQFQKEREFSNLVSPGDETTESICSDSFYRESSPNSLRILSDDEESESVSDRIHRKSFYSRFNEKKKKKKSLSSNFDFNDYLVQFDEPITQKRSSKSYDRSNTARNLSIYSTLRQPFSRQTSLPTGNDAGFKGSSSTYGDGYRSLKRTPRSVVEENNTKSKI